MAKKLPVIYRYGGQVVILFPLARQQIWWHIFYSIIFSQVILRDVTVEELTSKDSPYQWKNVRVSLTNQISKITIVINLGKILSNSSITVDIQIRIVWDARNWENKNILGELKLSKRQEREFQKASSEYQAVNRNYFMKLFF